MVVLLHCGMAWWEDAGAADASAGRGRRRRLGSARGGGGEVGATEARAEGAPHEQIDEITVHRHRAPPLLVPSGCRAGIVALTHGGVQQVSVTSRRHASAGSLSFAAVVAASRRSVDGCGGAP